MPSARSAKAPLIYPSGVSGDVEISLLPIQRIYEIAPLLVDETPGSSEGSIQLLEEFEYRYQITVENMSVKRWSTDRPEIFQPDTLDGRTGRIRTGSHTGWLPVVIFADDEPAGNITLEVRSRKLNYQNEYQWMMGDVAEALTEIVMYNFAATEQRFVVDDTRDAVTLYQRFAFLRSLVATDGFRAAISEIVKRPHVSWEQIHEAAAPGHGMKGTSFLLRQLARPGRRVPWPAGPIDTTLRTLDRCKTEVSLDTTPNRFVKFALTRWRGVVSRIEEILRQGENNPVRRRGIRETNQVLDELDAMLSEELFREVGALHRFPGNDQVLQKREGYREILRAYIQFDVASKLAWSGGEDVYGAGQRDVAMLYEFWVFIKLAKIIADLCDTKVDFSSLIEVKPDGLNVSLRKGRAKVLRGTANRLGRKLSVELWFNRTYGSSRTLGSETSWSEEMRPDYTLRIGSASGETAAFDPILLHFDAKYRLQMLNDVFGFDEEQLEPFSIDRLSTRREARIAARSDLLKMHAYRDAIRRSAGAYIIYPGTENDIRREYHELLPGLGAFAFRPTETGTRDGSDAIRQFVMDIFDHVASQITQHERGRFWLRQVFERSSPTMSRAPAADFLVAPPADTQVLVGFVKSQRHWEWIEKTRSYNLRADDRRGSVGLNAKELNCDLALLFEPRLAKTAIAQIVGLPQLRSREQLLASGYPDPRGSLYYCIEVDFLKAGRWQNLLTIPMIEKLRQRRATIRGAPVTLSWYELVEEVSLT